MTLSKELILIKLKATAIHLSLSILVFAVLSYLILYHWYPQPYFSIDGGWQGMRIIAVVDLVLGPLITLLIFDNRKSRREIITDLGIILVIQLGALAYGIHAAYSQRPAAIVILDNFVMPVTASEYGDSLKSLEELRQYSPESPPIIYSRVPDEASSGNSLQDKMVDLEGQVKNRALVEYYRPAEEIAPALRIRQERLRKRLKQQELEPAFGEWLESNGQSADSVLIEMFAGRYGTAWLVFDNAGDYLGYFLGLSYE